jgi:REP element-mobilizing transposase RayT
MAGSTHLRFPTRGLLDRTARFVSSTMPPLPTYHAGDAEPAFQLRYAWSGWTTGRHLNLSMLAEACRRAAPLWETDGFRLLDASCRGDLIQIVFSAKVDVAPVMLATRAKGRLQHELRAAGTPYTFSRKLALRSVGDTTTQTVEQYIASQVNRSSYVDPRWRTFLEELILIDPTIKLAEPTPTGSGRYWYNLHVVLVVASRYPVNDRGTLLRIRDTAQQVAHKKRYGIAAMSVMPDHLHMALRGAIEASPQDIALTFQNNLAYELGQNAIWQPSYYVGTFSEYDMDAIRRRVRQQCADA